MAEQKFCSKCGARLESGALFCGNCGRSTKPEPTPTEMKVQPGIVPIEDSISTADLHWVPDDGFQAHFFKTEGRLNRWRYFKRSILITLLFTAIIFAISLPFMDALGNNPKVIDYLITALDLGLLYSYYTLNVRRLHDMGKTEHMAGQAFGLGVIMDVGEYFVTYPNGNYNINAHFFWMYVICSVIYFILAIYFLFAEGKYGANEYGPDPLEGHH